MLKNDSIAQIAKIISRLGIMTSFVSVITVDKDQHVVGSTHEAFYTTTLGFIREDSDPKKAIILTQSMAQDASQQHQFPVQDCLNLVIAHQEPDTISMSVLTDTPVIYVRTLESALAWCESYKYSIIYSVVPDHVSEPLCHIVNLLEIQGRVKGPILPSLDTQFYATATTKNQRLTHRYYERTDSRESL